LFLYFNVANITQEVVKRVLIKWKICIIMPGLWCMPSKTVMFLYFPFLAIRPALNTELLICLKFWSQLRITKTDYVTSLTTRKP
jgi:hypothetical protein